MGKSRLSYVAHPTSKYGSLYREGGGDHFKQCKRNSTNYSRFVIDLAYYPTEEGRKHKLTTDYMYEQKFGI